MSSAAIPGQTRAKAVYLSRALARRVRWAGPDLLARRDGEDLVPPRGLSYVGGGDFLATGREHVALFADPGGLRPTDRVLDIGCGIGRMAVPLLDHLDAAGSYEGFDVGRAMIRWCEQHITARRADFRFTWVPVYNRKYNPFGSLAAAELRFPYEDESFDFAFATSLFTHLTEDDAAHYLRETRRVLRPGGRCLLTFFVLDDHALAAVGAGHAAFDFRFPVAGGLAIDEAEPEAAIAFRAETLEAMLDAAGLELDGPVRGGQWANRPDGPSGQDLVVARRI
jgi:ubiquinone/menaquinone biosynthesis C-methylase UbiE